MVPLPLRVMKTTVDLGDDGRVDALGEIGQDVVDVVAYLLRRHVPVLVEGERDDDLRDALARSGAKIVDPADGVDRALQLVRQLGLDLLGGGAVQVRRDEDGRKIDLGKEIEPERLVPDDADDEEGEHQHPGEHRAADAKRR
jgi:hypothetical protein